MDTHAENGLLLMVWIVSMCALFVLGEGIMWGIALYRQARLNRLKRRFSGAIPNSVLGGRPKARLF